MSRPAGTRERRTRMRELKARQVLCLVLAELLTLATVVDLAGAGELEAPLRDQMIGGALLVVCYWRVLCVVAVCADLVYDLIASVVDGLLQEDEPR